MTITSQSFPGRFYSLLLIGTGLIAVGIMSFLLLNNSTFSSQNISAIPVEVNFGAPSLNLVDDAGKTVSLKEHLGSVVLVNLWATWCPPCREEMPTLQSFYKKYKANNFVLIGIDQEESAVVVTPFVKELGLTFSIWLDIDSQAQREFKTVNLPSSYVIDRNGTVRLMWLGGISKKNLEKYVSVLIEE